MKLSFSIITRILNTRRDDSERNQKVGGNMTKAKIVEKVYKNVALSMNESEDIVEQVIEVNKTVLEGVENPAICNNPLF